MTEHLERVEAWNTAIAVLDASEIKLRDMIERELAEHAGLSHLKYAGTMRVVDRLMVKVGRLREAAFKKAFRHVRDAHDGL